MSVSILEIAPTNLSLRSKQYLEVFDTIFHRHADDALDLVKNIFNTEYDLPPEVVQMLANLFGFMLPDLSFMPEEDQEKIYNNFADNIFIFYRNRLKKEIFNHMLYVFGLTGDAYVLETYDWDYYYRTDGSYCDTNKFTDTGLYTDMEYTTDNLFRTPFVEIEVILDKSYVPGSDISLWYRDLSNAVKREMESIRFVLTKLFYYLVCPVDALENGTRTNDNDVVVVTGEITNKFDIRKYRLTYEDSTSDIFLMNDYDEDSTHYYYKTENIFTYYKSIVKIELLDFFETIIYSTIDCPEIFLPDGDTVSFEISIEKN